ncbi:hypothetical protein K488DRAFT_76737 [Vararia minispora EC-137]|uniref:Uncharacterized protein n=1 Tax=Vararia minispora EC-137 TaxID=1314806 RepID=A0ACB8QV94_9AGAM|nr:hypothetical protein K488DRAFT_76737 [Vararia minispora EC-137]
MTAKQGTLSFRALARTNEQRNQFGLRYHDYERYRKHCANRTHRLRSTLKMTHGKGREFKKLPAVPVDKLQDGHLELLLFEAERAWSYSQELLALAAQPSNAAKAAALRHNATGRHRRAVHWATTLLSQCQALHAAHRLPASALLEATAYTLLTNGRFLRARDELDDALVQLAVARAILDRLAASARSSRDQALAIAFADEVGPEIRFCAHELGRSRAYDVDAVVADVAGARAADIVEGYAGLLDELSRERASGAQDDARRRLAEMEWEGEPVPVRNPELVDVLIRVQDSEAKLARESDELKRPESEGDTGKKGGKRSKGNRSKRSVAVYDSVLLALSDAEEAARKLVEVQQLSGTTLAAAPGTRDIQFVHTYIVYQLLSRRIQRDLLLVSTLLSSQHASRRLQTEKGVSQKKEQVDSRLYPALVKLLDTVLQSLNQMRALSIVDDSPDLAMAVEARISYTNARRCLYLARCYTPVKRYAESLVLLQHAHLHLRQAHEALTDTPPTLAATTFYPLAPTDLAELGTTLDADAARAKADWFTHNGGRPHAAADGRAKPLFFDIALNYVQLDMNRLEERAGIARAPAKAAAAPSQKQQQKAHEEKAQEKKVQRAKVEEITRTATPEPAAPARGGLGSLLGGWWGSSK